MHRSIRDRRHEDRQRQNITNDRRRFAAGNAAWVSDSYVEFGERFTVGIEAAKRAPENRAFRMRVVRPPREPQRSGGATQSILAREQTASATVPQPDGPETTNELAVCIRIRPVRQRQAARVSIKEMPEVRKGKVRRDQHEDLLAD